MTSVCGIIYVYIGIFTLLCRVLEGVKDGL